MRFSKILALGISLSQNWLGKTAPMNFLLSSSLREARRSASSSSPFQFQLHNFVSFSLFWQIIHLGMCFFVSLLWHWKYVLQIDEHVQREIMNHRSLKHPNIIRFKEVGKRILTLLIMSEGCLLSFGFLFEVLQNIKFVSGLQDSYFFNWLSILSILAI